MGGGRADGGTVALWAVHCSATASAGAEESFSNRQVQVWVLISAVKGVCTEAGVVCTEEGPLAAGGTLGALPHILFACSCCCLQLLLLPFTGFDTLNQGMVLPVWCSGTCTMPRHAANISCSRISGISIRTPPVGTAAAGMQTQHAVLPYDRPLCPCTSRGQKASTIPQPTSMN